MSTLIIDSEVYRNFFYLGVLRKEDRREVGFELSDRKSFDLSRVRYFLRRNLSIGFNSIPYDLPIIYFALSGPSTSEIKDASDHLIQNRIPYWEAERELGIKIPDINHIDIFNTNPSVMSGLKALNGRMHHPRLQELPYPIDAILTHDEMDRTIEYCHRGDLIGTEMLYDRLTQPIALRESLRKTYGSVDLRSKSDAQVGETIIKTRVEAETGGRIKRVNVIEGTKFKYHVPEWIKFETPYMQWVLGEIRNTEIEIGKGGKIQFPKEFDKFDINFAGMKYTLGIGGLHSTEANRAILSDNQHILIEGDVASQYPNIIMTLGLYPAAMGLPFQKVYRSLVEARLAAKAIKDKAADGGLKIAINGSYGKLGSRYSTLFAPHLLVAVTLTGQLSLLMLIERAAREGIPIVSANTDGIIFRCPRDKFNGFVMKDGRKTDRMNPSPIQDIIDWWEGVTKFHLEFGEFRASYNQSVNCYIALDGDGGFKRKGVLANHWRETLPWGGKNTDFDPYREGLKKNPQMTIMADAVLGYLLHGIPIEKTIRECTDIREFLTIITANGGATWGPGRAIIETRDRPDGNGKVKGLFGYEDEHYLGRLVRFYWSTQGNPIVKLKGHAATGIRPIVPKTDGSRPAMNLPADFLVPDDLDYARYIREAYLILESIGGSEIAKQAAPSPLEHLLASYLTNQLYVEQTTWNRS